MKDILGKKVTCLGAGTIGSSWALLFGLRGCQVRIYDIEKNQLEEARETIKNSLETLADQGMVKKEEVPNVLNRIVFLSDLEAALKGTMFIQESVKESYDVKRSLLAAVDAFAPADAIFSSSTSGLLVSEIAKNSPNPARCIGGHPYNPPHLIPLVEISKGEKTSKAVIETAVEFYKSVGKEPVVLERESPGFLGNRLSFALYREAISLVRTGVCSVEDIDKVLCSGIGLRWAVLGPVMLYELGGGPDGILGMKKHDVSLNSIFADLSNANRMPDDWYDIAVKGLEQEKKSFSKGIGPANEDISRYRDKMLIRLSKLKNLDEKENPA